MAEGEGRRATFICPACGRSELPLDGSLEPNEAPYVQLAEMDACEEAKTARFVFGDGFTAGFGGVVRDLDEEGGERERWVPPRAVVAYHFARNDARVGRAEPMSGFYPQPLYRNLSKGGGTEDVYVAMAFLPHNEAMTPEMRSQGEALAKSLG